MSIIVENLSKTYGKQKALDQVSLSVGTGRITGLLGPNGAGKSTTMKTLSSVLPIESGRCLINGKDLKTNSRVIKRQLGYLPENNPLYDTMYVREILQYEAKYHKLNNPIDQAEKVIRITGLLSECHKKISQLSKGYRQRVGLAMAIIHDPEVLILDEPTSGLDPNQILEIRKLIKELGREKTVLLSTHIMQEAQELCDEIIIVHKGKIKVQFELKNIGILYPGKSLEDVFVQLTKD